MAEMEADEFADRVSAQFTEEARSELRAYLLVMVEDASARPDSERAALGTALFQRLAKDDQDGVPSAARSMFALGFGSGAAAAWRVLQLTADDADASQALEELERHFADLPLNETRVLHEAAQHALLRQIARRAEAAIDSAELAQLADAYLTLPAPDEDE